MLYSLHDKIWRMSFFPLIPKLRRREAAILCGVLTFCMVAISQVSRRYLGVSADDLTPDRVIALNLRNDKGAEITQVGPDSPAANAGLREHDVVVSFNGQSVINADQLKAYVQTWTSSSARIGIVRGGQAMMMYVSAQNSEPPVSADRDSDDLNVKRKEFESRTPFIFCKEKPGSYFAGPFPVSLCPQMTRDVKPRQSCESVLEMQTTDDKFPHYVIQPNRIQPSAADRLNYGTQWTGKIIISNYAVFRMGYRVDGIWLWSAWRNVSEVNIDERPDSPVANLFKEKGHWFALDRRDVFGVGSRAIPFDEFLNTLNVHPSCADLLKNQE